MASVDFKIELKGLAELTRKLDARIRRLQQASLRRALLAFAEPIRAAAERYAHSLISPRLKVIAKVKIRGDGGTVVIGPPTEAFEVKPSGRSVSHANIAYWFEFGYDIRSKPKGPSLRHIGARPLLTPAYQSQKAAALEAFENVIRAELEAEAPA